MRVRKIDYTVGAGISQGNKPYVPGERRKYQKPGEQGDYKAIARNTSFSEEELAEVKEEGGVIKTEGTAVGRKIDSSLKRAKKK